MKVSECLTLKIDARVYPPLPIKRGQKELAARLLSANQEGGPHLNRTGIYIPGFHLLVCENGVSDGCTPS